MKKQEKSLFLPSDCLLHWCRTLEERVMQYHKELREIQNGISCFNASIFPFNFNTSEIDFMDVFPKVIPADFICASVSFTKFVGELVSVFSTFSDLLPQAKSKKGSIKEMIIFFMIVSYFVNM